MKKIIRVICAILAVCSLAFGMASCSGADMEAVDTGSGANIVTGIVMNKINSKKASNFKASKSETDYVLIKVKDYGEIVVVLRDDVAPISVANFKKLVKEGFYNGTIFHRVISSFMIQGGGYEVKDGKAVEKDATNIKGEFKANGVTNNLLHVRGVISMARATDPNSASSQFFITQATSSHLDGSYAAFGYVLAGMDVVDAISVVKTNSSDKPETDVVIESITFVNPK